MKILIAEDDELLRAVLADFLTELGHQVGSAADGRELIEMALNERPDLVITDLRMPGMAGDSMIAMLEIHPGLSGIPVIIITGATQTVLAGMGIPREIPVLPKPFDFARIILELGRVPQRGGTC